MANSFVISLKPNGTVWAAYNHFLPIILILDCGLLSNPKRRTQWLFFVEIMNLYNDEEIENLYYDEKHKRNN